MIIVFLAIVMASGLQADQHKRFVGGWAPLEVHHYNEEDEESDSESMRDGEEDYGLDSDVVGVMDEIEEVTTTIINMPPLEVIQPEILVGLHQRMGVIILALETNPAVGNRLSDEIFVGLLGDLNIALENIVQGEPWNWICNGFFQLQALAGSVYAEFTWGDESTSTDMDDFDSSTDSDG